MSHARWTQPGHLLVGGLIVAAAIVTALGVWLREEVGTAPRELAQSVQRLEASADFARFRSDLEVLFRAHPKFHQAFRGILPEPPHSLPAPPGAMPRAYLLSPIGVAPTASGTPFQVRWFDGKGGTGEIRRLDVRLCPAAGPRGGDGPPTGRRAATPTADEARETGPLPLAEARRLPDGSLVAELAFEPGPEWTRIRIGAGSATEDSQWFRTTEPGVAGVVPLAQSKHVLARICRQGLMTRSQADLLLAMLLGERGFDLAQARLLELVGSERRSSPAAAALLQAAYGRLGRPEGLPREPAMRDDAASWGS